MFYTIKLRSKFKFIVYGSFNLFDFCFPGEAHSKSSFKMPIFSNKTAKFTLFTWFCSFEISSSASSIWDLICMGKCFEI